VNIKYGIYPIDLYLLERTSMTLNEVESMDKEKKLKYYFYLKEKEKQTKQIIQKQLGRKRSPKSKGEAEAIYYFEDLKGRFSEVNNPRDKFSEV